ncbi:MAG: magnesium transporter [Myxococcota bacterium]|jgi:magnesium transporter
MGNLTSRRRRRSQRRALTRGKPPGAPIYTGDHHPDEVVTVALEEYDCISHGTEKSEAALARLAGAHDPANVSWLNIDGIHDPAPVKRVAEAFKLHPLWTEDILNPLSRAKVDSIDERIFVVIKMLSIDGDEIAFEQVSLVAGPGWLLTFQEGPGDVWDPVRRRLQSPTSRLRQRGPDYLLHALMDAVVDEYFAVVDHLDGRIDTLESDALDAAGHDLHVAVHEVRQELQRVRGVVWAMRELVGFIVKAEAGVIDAETLPFFRDLYDHIVQVMDLVDASRDRLAGVYNLHLGVTSHRLNETMRVLTIVATVFIPITFVAGVYGMNFEVMPEVHWAWGYPASLVLMASIGAGMLGWFRHRGWL